MKDVNNSHSRSALLLSKIHAEVNRGIPVRRKRTSTVTKHPMVQVESGKKRQWQTTLNQLSLDVL